MRAHLPKLQRLPSWVLLTLAVLCAVPALIPIKPGIRIPVHCANEVMVYIDDTGKVALPGRWYYAVPFEPSGTGHVANKNRGCWKISRTGKLIRCPGHPLYSQRDPASLPIGPDARSMTLLRDHGKFRWTLADGRPAFPGVWDAAAPFHGDSPAAVCKDGYWGFIDRSGREVLPREWDLAWSFDEEGLACVCRNNQWGAIDLTGKLVIPLHFNSMSGFDAGGLCAVAMTSGSGFINRQGKIVIPCRFTKVHPFDAGGLARVVQTTGWHKGGMGWIDRTGRTVIPFEFDYREPSKDPAFKDHPTLLPVQIGHRSGLLDRQGRWVVPLGDGTLWRLNDPSAPEREWYVRAPDSEDKPGAAPPPFQPGCYDERGRLIWSGTRYNWREPFRVAAIVFGISWFLQLGWRFIRHRQLMRPPRQIYPPLPGFRSGHRLVQRPPAPSASPNPPLRS